MSKRRPLQTNERVAIFLANDGLCHICGEKINADTDRWDVEHATPLCLGGDDTRGSENLRLAHIVCHARKSRGDRRRIAKARLLSATWAGMKPEELRAARLGMGLSQADLAKVMDVDANSVARFEQGRRSPPVRYVRLLRAYLAGYRPEDWPE